MDKIPTNNLPMDKVEELANSPTEARADRKPKRERTARTKSKKGESQKERGESQAARLFALFTTDDYEYFVHAGKAYCSIVDNLTGKSKVYALHATAFTNAMQLEFMEKHKNPASSTAINDVKGGLAAIASKTEREVFRRVALHNGHVYINLCDEKGRCVRITEKDWCVINKPPVLFTHSPEDLPLPKPRKGGSMDALRKYIRTRTEEEFVLLQAFIVGALTPLAAYPMLVFSSGQGTGKSLAMEIVKSLVDPSNIVTRMMMEGKDELVLAVSSSWLCGIDNVSYISPTIADVFCTVLTGSSYSTRALYKNDEEFSIRVCRPIMVNGIGTFIVRGDLMDRALTVMLAPIPPSERRPKADLVADFETDRATIFGAVCDLISNGLRNKHMEFERLPRLADFARFAAQCFERGGGEGRKFLATLFNEQEQLFIDQAKEDYTMQLIERCVDKYEEFSGTVSELYEKLKEFVPSTPYGTLPREFPASVSMLGKALARLEQHFSAVGIYYHVGRRNRANTVWFRRVTAE